MSKTFMNCSLCAYPSFSEYVIIPIIILFILKKNHLCVYTENLQIVFFPLSFVIYHVECLFMSCHLNLSRRKKSDNPCNDDNYI